MFAFLRNLFKAPEPLEVELSFDDMELWFQGRANEKIFGLDGTVQDFNAHLRQIQHELRRQRERLLGAQIKYDGHIEPRVGSIVAGHRDNYCRELALFLNAFNIPEQTNIIESYALSKQLQTKLDAFAEQTAKSYGATRHLFHTDVDAIAATLKELDEALRNFLGFLQEHGVLALENVKRNIILLHNERQKLSRLEEEIVAKKQRLEYAQKQCLSKKQELAALMGSSERAGYAALLEKRDALRGGIISAEREIKAQFIELDRGLRKYEHLQNAEKQDVVHNYLADPVNALVLDSQMFIVDVLERLQKAVPLLGFGEDEQQKIIRQVQRLKPHYFQEIRGKYNLLKKELDNLQVTLAQDQFLLRQKEAEYKLQHFEQQAARFEQEIHELEEAVQAGKVGALASEIKSGIKDSLGIQVSLRVDNANIE